MATVDVSQALTANTHPSRHGAVRVPYVVDQDVDIADVLTAKGSALAASDVVTVLRVPAGTLIMAGGVEIVTPGDSTTLTYDVGTGVDADVFVDGVDGKSAAGTYAQAPAAYQPVLAVAEDTVDVTLATLTGTLTTGKIRVWAMFCDVTDIPSPGLAKVGS